MVLTLHLERGLLERSRYGTEALSVEWIFYLLPFMLEGRDLICLSDCFRIGDEVWRFELRPNCRKSDSGSLFMRLDLVRKEGGAPFQFSICLKREEERIRGRVGEFSRDRNVFTWYFCSMDELREDKTRLAPNGWITISCVLRRTGAGDARDDASILISEDEFLFSDKEFDKSSVSKNPSPTMNKAEIGNEISIPRTSSEREFGHTPLPSNTPGPISFSRRDSSTSEEELPSAVLVTYSYKQLKKATQNFRDQPIRDGGCRIGEGSFGTVYRAVIRGDVVAVKKLKDPVDKPFRTELETLTNYRHENLLPLIGFSLDATCCLLYEYMPNGSLLDRLACVDGSDPLSWQTRLSISHGTARGIYHLHTFGDKPMVHRDIKSANILLDENFVPKVGDFGLVRTGSRGGSSTQVVTENASGTSCYMPREAFMGEVSIKLDTFSFGVVLLELLTGLPPFNPEREDRDLVSYMENCKDVLPRLDRKAKWNEQAATELYRIAQRCVVQSRCSRPTISEILQDLTNCLLYTKKKKQGKMKLSSKLLSNLWKRM